MALGCATVDAEVYYQSCCEKICEAREWTARTLESLGFRVLPSKANFLFASHPQLTGEALYTGLRQRGILVRHFRKERIKDYVRITIGTQAQMERLVRALEEMTGGNL